MIMKRVNLVLHVTIVLVAISKEISNVTAKNIATSKLSKKESDARKDYAAQMLSYMNQSVNPCDDYYEYACGNWKNTIKDRLSTKRRNNFLDIIYKLDDIAATILERSNINDLAPEYAAEFQLAKNFYHNCLQAELYPTRYSPEYLAVLKEIGGFPAVDSNWNGENFHWLNMSAHLSNYGVNSFINDDVIPEYPFPPYFKIPNFGLDIQLHDDTINNSSSNAYIENAERMRDILTIYKVEPKHIDKTVTEIFNFLKKILKALQEFNENPFECQSLSQSMKESDLKTIKSKWIRYFDNAWSGITFADVDGYEACCSPCFYLYHKLDKICEENKKAAANYLALKFLFHMNENNKAKKYQKDVCISNVKSSLIYFFDHLYMKLHFNEGLRAEISDILKGIRQSLRTILQESEWLDEATRKAALLKESTITERIGRFEDPALAKLLIGEMKNLKFIKGNYEANYLNLRKFKQHMARFHGLNYEKLSNTTKPQQLLVGMEANNFYYNTDNSINMMAGIFRAPSYNRSWPNSLKYGTFGYLVGHELTHGFDTDGAGHDHEGKEVYWWSEKSAKLFAERTDCYVAHYQKYLIPEINRNINGNVTKDENIADGGGLREALMAYRRHLQDVTNDFNPNTQLYKDEQMPGIDLSPEQLFFLGFAQMWCASYKEADYWTELSDPHTIDKYRVLGALSNNNDFAGAYGCAVGTNMNPMANKCRVW